MESTTNNYEIAVLEDVRLEDVPRVVSDQFTLLTTLENRIKKAEKSAKDAQKSAKTASEKSIGLLGRGTKDAVYAAQDAATHLAQAQSDTVDAVKLSFQYQEKLAKATGYLFGLGVRNIAMNRIVVQQIKAQLENASEEQLSDMARKEMENVLKQLKAQEDMADTIEKEVNRGKKRDVELSLQKEKLEGHDQRLAEQLLKDKGYEEQLALRAEKDIAQDKELARQADKDIEHDRRLAEQVAKDVEHDTLLAQQAEKDIEHDKILAHQIEKDEEHDRLFAQQELKDAEHDRLLAQQAEKDLEHDEQLAHQVEKDLEHDSRLNEQAEKGIEHDQRLAELEKRADSHDTSLAEHGDGIAGNADAIKEQAAMIAQLNEEIANLKLALETKASKKSDLISLILAGLSLLGVIIHFFI